MVDSVRLSIVVPVGPTDEAWRDLLAQLQHADECFEVVLVFAGSAPDGLTQTTRGGAPIRMINSQLGRAQQMNAGARAACGEWLWFLHADSRLYADLALLLRPRDPNQLYYFNLRFFDGPVLLRLNAMFVWLRTRLWGMPFGDQGFLLSSKLFDRVGGFDLSLPAGEDHALAWAAYRLGVPVKPIGAVLGTSGRRYAEFGWLRTTWYYASQSFKQARQFKAMFKPKNSSL
jgi:glycosyltransferase involved in cell wall biosynthesis